MNVRKNERGFSLIEILAAFPVVMIAGLATTTLMVTTTRFLVLDNQRSDAVRYAQEVVEELRASDYATIESGSRVSDDGRYTITWTATENPTLNAGLGAEEQMTLIAVTVTWDWFGSEQEYEIATVYADLHGSPTDDDDDAS